MTRTEAIWAAIQDELLRRRALVDADQDLVRLTISVKLQAGTALVRGRAVEEERIERRDTRS